MAVFGWNSEESQTAAVWWLAAAARTQLKAYPGRGEQEGWRAGKGQASAEQRRGLQEEGGGRGRARWEDGEQSKS